MTEKISALCISHPSRYGLLQRSIYNFLEQTYENAELVILVDDNNYHALMLGWLRDKRHSTQVLDQLKSKVIIRKMEGSGLTPMATYGISLCSGDYIVVWDDDNLSHPTRILLFFPSRFTTSTIATSYMSQTTLNRVVMRLNVVVLVV